VPIADITDLVASLIKAGANWQKGIEGEKSLPPESAGRSVEEYLAVLLRRRERGQALLSG
jgi:hypothetical protein